MILSALGKRDLHRVNSFQCVDSMQLFRLIVVQIEPPLRENNVIKGQTKKITARIPSKAGR